MKKSGLADSPFFALPRPDPGQSTPASPVPAKTLSSAKASGEKKQKSSRKREAAAKTPKTQPRDHDTTIPRDHDTTVSRYHDTMVEVVRRAVKEYGKEAATHRFTLAEKKAIADIIYAYKGREIRTSENEIARIAVNYIIHDYRENGENSVLDRILKVLNS